MKLKIDRKVLLNAAKKVAKSAGGNSASQITACILLEADWDKRILKLTATNLVTIMQIKLKAEAAPKEIDIEDSGSAIIPADLFVNMLGGLDGDDVDILMNKCGIMTMQSKAAIFTFQTMNGEFPALNIAVPDEMVSVNGISVIAGKTLQTAEQNSEQSSQLGGVYLRLSRNISTASATNGIAFVKACGGGISDGSLEVFMPGKSVRILMSCAAGIDELYAGIKGNHITFLGSDFVFSSLLLNDAEKIKGAENVIAKIEPKYSMTLNAKELLDSIERCNCLNFNADSCVDIFVTDKGLKLSVNNENGDCEMSVEGDDVTGVDKSAKAVMFHYNPKMILDYLKNCKKTVYLSFDASGIMKITDTETDSTQTDYIVCPRRERKIKEIKVKKELATKTEPKAKAKKGKTAKTAA